MEKEIMMWLQRTAIRMRTLASICAGLFLLSITMIMTMNST